MEIIILPRRHSPRTLGLLLCWYAGAGLLGMVAATTIFAALYFFGMTPEKFIPIFVSAIPGAAVLLYLGFRHLVHPRIRMDREAAHQEIDEYLNRQRR